MGRISVSDFRHEALDEVGSTNEECLARARAGQESGLWITANRQTGGRARRGRTWVSERGNLYASLLLIDPAPLAMLGSLPLAVAVALHRAAGRVLPLDAPALEVKWPNDLLIGRRKVSGILIEGEFLPDGRHVVVIGIGINVRFKPDNPLYPVTCLVDEGASVFPDELFAHLFEAMAHVLEIWDSGRGIAKITTLWRDVACGIGEPITVNLSDRSLRGRFVGIDDQGLLQMELEDGGRETISAGDVFFG
ncbi:biotin--[acetyl-CoA-carboxylase] ligase [Rhizobiaceae bacterium BDR2-2]|uniref:biotin--[biotin carboxyl-carrier protein] ligase n=1 Tax=Ectorhizobium quercum TaxID=2965071 RepID=A0AAE3SW19_9HYPH|nr:biotin--[acetyl-CoA-carboxylase] ligase [Ectorhizobium quercum]MCX8998915.1 biotin--[acetyl-CoA-carboxylase] ligase [Ectorhizobium quercum]